jgi:hypothetical protein
VQTDYGWQGAKLNIPCTTLEQAKVTLVMVGDGYLN